MEIVSNKWRTPIGVSFQISFAIGYMILSGIAYEWRDWHEMNVSKQLDGGHRGKILFPSLPILDLQQ